MPGVASRAPIGTVAAHVRAPAAICAVRPPDGRRAVVPAHTPEETRRNGTVV